MEIQATASLSFLAPAMDGIVNGTLTAFHAVPRRGAEMGGLLLGRYEDDRIVVEDFEPVVCEHRLGPSYILSETDLRGLEETLQSCVSKHSGSAVVGFCRSHTRAESGVNDRDRELFQRYFPDARAVFLLLKPDQHRIEATYFVRSGGILTQAAGPLPFPSEAPVDLFAVPAAEAPVEQPEQQTEPDESAETVSTNGADPAPLEEPEHPSPVPWPPPPPRSIPPPTRPRLTAPSFTIADEERPSRDRRWVAVVAVLCGAAGILGFWSLDSGRQSASPPPSAPAPTPEGAPQQAARPVPAVPAASAPRSPAPSPSSPRPAIQQMLNEWERALRTGNPAAIAAFYAPRVDSYFGERNVSSAAVARSLARSAARYGKTVVVRVSGMHITPMGDDRATVTFRKHWQTSGKHMYTGETEERLILANGDDGWKIVSEQETRVLWTQRSR